MSQEQESGRWTFMTPEPGRWSAANVARLTYEEIADELNRLNDDFHRLNLAAISYEEARRALEHRITIAETALEELVQLAEMGAMKKREDITPELSARITTAWQNAKLAAMKAAGEVPM